jgi:recombinational DNA repair protein (RecF pathway)
LLVRFGGRGEVKTLRSAEAVSLALPLSGITLYSGLYVNELSPVLEHETRFSELFFDYLHCIQALAGASGRRNRRCAVLNWRCWGTWAMAWIFCTAPAAVSR